MWTGLGDSRLPDFSSSSYLIRPLWELPKITRERENPASGPTQTAAPGSETSTCMPWYIPLSPKARRRRGGASEWRSVEQKAGLLPATIHIVLSAGTFALSGREDLAPFFPNPPTLHFVSSLCRLA
ncbi:hypothetical protein BS47DRAFT_884908 [Hydnum rufescens UP504]|uniref:Uncharacterized protein n=1 Tax=Hydnum rufescens UP504 TaxID=1448309 RepID=A0A9P6DUI3_9AGAM|nr:hypothetical protein BS47DRAFT_884908 [Hydnum rufescens UP504]